ncbi:unnamed protein product [Strongylus vulgaris]|uniref:Uncharacterized protein n=1 Tax=Strongylus vulgaris TaxID=40348 RepID=A0A3P7IG76_STRVU|nr:unnamed protein product [Strongylus vulgaris]
MAPVVVTTYSGYRIAKYNRGLPFNRVSQAEKVFDVSGSLDAQLSVEHDATDPGVRQLIDGTLIIRGDKVPSWNVGGVGIVVHLFAVHHVDSIEIILPRLAIFRLRPLHQKTITIIRCHSSTSAAEGLVGTYTPHDFFMATSTS